MSIPERGSEINLRMRPVSIALTLILTQGICVAQAPTLGKFVYMIRVPRTIKHEVAIQTGFRLAGTKGIITSLHGVVGAPSLSAFNESGDVITGLTISMVDVKQDLALLSSAELVKRSAAGLALSGSRAVPNESLEVFGHPAGINLYIKPVTVSKQAGRRLSDLIPPGSAEEFRERDSPASAIPVISIDGNLVPGDSGAPVLDGAGRVLGVVDGGLLGGAAAISWAIPLSAVKWKDTGESQADLQRIENLNVGDLFASQESREPGDEKPLFAAEIGAPIVNPGQFWAVYTSGEGETVSPIDVLIGCIEIVNLQDRAVSLTSVALEMNDGRSWIQLRRIPLSGVRLFSGPLQQAGEITVDPGDLNLSLVNTEIPPGKTIRGAGIFEYKDAHYRFRGDSRPKFRITIADTARNRVQLIDTDPADHLAAADDPFGGTQQIELIFAGKVRNLSSLRLRYFLPPTN